MTTNVEKSKNFYTSILGIHLESDDPFGSTLRLHNASLRITEVPEFSPSPHPILGWEVGDLKASVQELNSKGVKMEIYDGFGQDQQGIWGSPDGKTKLAWLLDPDKNVLCLMEIS